MAKKSIGGASKKLDTGKDRNVSSKTVENSEVVLDVASMASRIGEVIGYDNLTTEKLETLKKEAKNYERIINDTIYRSYDAFDAQARWINSIYRFRDLVALNGDEEKDDYNIYKHYACLNKFKEFLDTEGIVLRPDESELLETQILEVKGKIEKLEEQVFGKKEEGKKE